ncbi:MAG: hypothetical protein M1368_12525 [Thaumarchaeota archaeon]|nr:hypothetical protein [Nitrososphaerota archaeon]
MHPILIPTSGSVSLTAIYSTSSVGGINDSSIFVSSEYTNGSQIEGMYVELSKNGATIASGFTPIAFTATSGQTYAVTPSDYTSAYFNEWSDGVITRAQTIVAKSSQISIAANHTTTSQLLHRQTRSLSRAVS